MSSSAPAVHPAVVAPGEVALRGVGKQYRRGGRGGLRSLVRGADRDGDPVVALDGIDLEVGPGDSLGLIGPNGSGKSTLLKILAGVTEPSSGAVRCGGPVGAMIELELGFHAELTGIENLQASAALAGCSPAQLRRVLPEVLDFAGLGDAVHAPLKQYSTGMRARLGFALATHLPAAVLLVDEVLAVGDVEFQMRCVDRIQHLLAAGTTLVFVSHEMHLIDAVCERAVRLQGGQIVDDGPSPEVIERYLAPSIDDLRPVADGRMQLGEVVVRRTEIEPWEAFELEVDLEVAEVVPEAALAVQVSWQSIAPDHPIGYAEHPLPAQAGAPGRHRLLASSTPIPLDSGHARLEVALLDAQDRRTLDRKVGELWITGRATRKQPSLAVDVDWQLERTGEVRPPEGQRVPPGLRPAAGLDQVVKQFTDRWRGSHLWSRRRGAAPLPPPVRALDGVTLAFDREQVTGIIGPNGAGKTTLLRVLAGVSAPSSGTAWVEGRLVSMLDLGLGFHPDLTGLENIEISGRLLGLSRRELAEAMPEMLAFAGIGDAVHQPFRQYSSGMKARLGMGLALHAGADVLLIDETLSVGDQDFRERAIERLQEVCREGAAAVFVSHEMDVVGEVCDRVVRLDRGQVVADGPADEVLADAGGRIADRGVRQVTNDVRLHPLSLPKHHIAGGEDLVVEVLLEVVSPSPRVRLEISYRAHPDISPAELPVHELGAHTMMSRVVEPVGGRLARPGWYRGRATIERNAFLGDVFVFVTAVDEVGGEVVAEAWHDVVVGTRAAHRTPQISFDATWTVAGA